MIFKVFELFAKHVLLLLVGCVFVVGCAPERPSEKSQEVKKGTTSTEADQRPVAVIDGEEITVEDFERRLGGMTPYARVRYNTVEKRQELLDAMVAFELLAREAKSKGYDKDPAVLHAVKDTMVRRMLDDELRKKVSPSDISEADVERAYRERQKEYAHPEQRRGALISVGTEDVLKTLMERVEPLKEKPLKERVNNFRVLASRYNLESEIAGKGGDIGFLNNPASLKGTEAPNVHAEQLFALNEVGDISGAYKLGDTWNVVLLLDKKSATKRPISEATSELRQYLYKKKRHEAREELIKSLKDSATIEVNDGVLESIKPPEGSISLDDLNFGSTPVRDLKRTQK